MKFMCKKCLSKLELRNTTTIIYNGEPVTKEARCCNGYMAELIEDRGVPNVIRNERNGE